MLIESFFLPNVCIQSLKCFFQTCYMIKIKMLRGFFYEYIVFLILQIYAKGSFILHKPIDMFHSVSLWVLFLPEDKRQP